MWDRVAESSKDFLNLWSHALSPCTILHLWHQLLPLSQLPTPCYPRPPAAPASSTANDHCDHARGTALPADALPIHRSPQYMSMAPTLASCRCRRPLHRGAGSFFHTRHVTHPLEVPPENGSPVITPILVSQRAAGGGGEKGEPNPRLGDPDS